jgi:hypothetical protein
MAVQVIPVFGMPGYEALTHGGRINGNGHFTITAAYPNYASNCTRFSQRLCDGQMQGGGY